MNQLASNFNKRPAIRKAAAMLLILFATWQVSDAANYVTMSDGDWQDNSIWSTDGGATSCGCNPGAAVVNDSVKVEHDLTVGINIQIKSNSCVVVDSFGRLIGTTHRVDVQSGRLWVKGELHTKEIIVDPGAQFDGDGFITIANAPFNNSGISTVNGKLTIAGANRDLNNAGGAQLTIGMSGNITVATGDVVNEGLLIFAPVSCASINGGGDFNNSGASSAVVGVGAVWVGGTLINDGYWDNNVSWCADSTAGLGSLPPKDCNTSCGPLPVIIAEFTAAANDNDNVELRWMTSLELNNDYFTIEKSSDGINFNWMQEVDADGSGEYVTTDEETFDGTAFYRLSQTDMNGVRTILETREVTTTEEMKIQAFPNPFSSQLHVNLCGFNKVIDQVQILDMSGKVVWKTGGVPVVGGKGDLTIQTNNMQAGVYFLIAKEGVISRQLKIVKL